MSSNYVDNSGNPTQTWDRNSDEEKSPFLRLSEDGDAFVIALLGKPHLHEVFWDGGSYRPYDATARENHVRGQLRMGINVAICQIERVDQRPSMSITEVRIWEFSRHVFFQLRSITPLFTPSEWLFLVERIGQPRSKDTRYVITPIYSLVERDIDALQDLELYDLYEVFGADTTGCTQAQPPSITPEERQRLIDRIEEVEDADFAHQRFCDRFRISRVEDLPKEKFEAALTFIDNLATIPVNPFE